MKRALYPGTFDPITNGHVDIIKRASRMFEELVVAVATRGSKDPLFSHDLRKRLAEESVREFDNVRVESLDGLLAEECSRLGTNVVVRGLRAVSDFEYEMMMALMNRKLNPDMETVFLMPSLRYVYLHSSLVREVHSFGGDISDLVPPPVLAALKSTGRSPRG
jgi:pantetheine-phosphate adenylyltransferase